MCGTGGPRSVEDRWVDVEDVAMPIEKEADAGHRARMSEAHRILGDERGVEACESIE